MNLLICFAKSFLSLFAIMRLVQMETKNPLSIILFIAFFYIYTKLSSSTMESRISSKDPIIAGILSVIFTIFTMAATCYTQVEGLSSTLFCTVIQLVSAVGFWLIFYHVMLWILTITDSIRIDTMLYPLSCLPYVAFFACIIGWLPYFLFEYPGVMTPDSVNQYAQVIGAYELTNHHAVIHTLLIGFFYKIGMALTGNVYTALACYTLFQMICMAFVAAYVVRTMQKAGLHTAVCIITICFYCFMPYNGIFAVTIWKDVLFAGNVTLFAAACLRLLLQNSREKITPLQLFTIVLPYVVSGFMICLLRTNGWYAFLISLPFILFAFRERLKLMLPVHAVILLLVLFVKYPCMQIYEIKQADFVESVSIPVQQIARVVVSGQSLTEDQTATLAKMVDISRMQEVYQPDVSDGVKNLIRETGNGYIETHKGEFLSLWFSIGLRHPKAYFDAYVDQTKGFWYPDVSYEVGLADGIYPNEFGLTWQSITGGHFMIKLREILFKLQDIIPLYGCLWSMGTMFWLVLIVAGICIRNQKTANILPAIPAIAIILTLCIATPVATEFRYAYALVYGLPLYLMLPFVQAKL